MNLQVEDDDENRSDNKDWSFKKTSVGWHFERNFVDTSSSIPTSSGWLSKPKPQLDSCTIKQEISSQVSDTNKHTYVATRNFKDEEIKETVNSSRITEDVGIPSLSEKCLKTHSESLTGNEKKKESENSGENERKLKYTIPKLSEAISNNDEDFYSELGDIDFSEELEEPISSHSEKSHQEVEDTKVAYLSNSSGKTLVRAPAHALGSNNKSKDKRGIQYCDDPETERAERDTSNKKYENVLSGRKRELKGSDWIDARKIKKKVKSNLFSKV